MTRGGAEMASIRTEMSFYFFSFSFAIGTFHKYDTC